MKASELRIGNYVYFNKHCKEIGVISSIMAHIDGCETVGLNSRVNMTYDIDELEPIQLTEEWLLKLGFTKKDHTWSDKSKSIGLFFNGRYFIENSREGFLFCQLHYSGQGWFICNIEYVHQLQNLYYALTGRELTDR